MLRVLLTLVDMMCRSARVSERMSVKVCYVEIGGVVRARGADLLSMFARKAAVGAWWRGCESCLQERRDWLMYGRGGESGRESGGLVGMLSHALISSSCEQARAIARQYFTSLCLKLSFTWAGSPLTATLADQSSNWRRRILLSSCLESNNLSFVDSSGDSQRPPAFDLSRWAGS